MRNALPITTTRIHNLAMVLAFLAAVANTESRQARGESNSPLPPSREEMAWPQLRGPNYDGHSSEKQIANRWPPEGPPVLWTRALGRGYSGFAAWDDRVATQYQTLAGQYVVCLDANSGETIWRHRYGLPFEPAGVYPGPRATPTFAGRHIFFAGPYGRVGCLDARTGRLRWSVNVCRQFGSRGTGFGYSCSPTVLAGMVIFPVGGPGASMVALDERDGSVVWQAGDDAASYAPAYPITFRGRELVIGYMQNALVCHDLRSGERVWRRALSSGYDEHSVWPVYSEPYLWIASAFQAGSELLQLTDDPEQPIRTVRKSRLMSNDIFSSVLHHGSLYGFDLREAQAKTHRPSRGQFRCIDFMTGEPNWSTGSPKLRRATGSQPEDVGTRIGHATVIIADEKLILMNDTGELILAKAIKERYEELARVSVLGGEICWTQPTLSRGRLFVRNQSRAACIFLGEPDSLEPQLAASASTVADIPQSEYVDLASLILSVEPEYAFDIPSDAWIVRWYIISVAGIIGGAHLSVGTLRFLMPRQLTPSGARWLGWTLAFVLGALGTTFLSRWLDDFIFTWPVSIFIAFEAAVWTSELRSPTVPQTAISQTEPPTGRWRGRVVALGFAAICLVYFLLCRRLSLVFEWVFLCGFPAALPPLIAVKFYDRTNRANVIWQYVTTAVAFSAFYWFAVAVLWWKT